MHKIWRKIAQPPRSSSHLFVRCPARPRSHCRSGHRNHPSSWHKDHGFSVWGRLMLSHVVLLCIAVVLWDVVDITSDKKKDRMSYQLWQRPDWISLCFRTIPKQSVFRKHWLCNSWQCLHHATPMTPSGILTQRLDRLHVKDPIRILHT